MNNCFISVNKELYKLLHTKKLYAIFTNNSIPVVREGKLVGIHYHLNDDNEADDYSFDLSLYDDAKLLSRFDSSSINERVFFTKEDAYEKANSIRESMNKNMSKKKPENTGKFKITKNKYYRVNFSYQGKHYSIQQMGDTYEQYVALTCKEDKDFYVTPNLWNLNNLIPNMPAGQTYRDTDLSNIQKLIDKYIVPYLNDKPELVKETEEVER